jgi:uncharacterized repeat protein (TIGR03843 family)
MSASEQDAQAREVLTHGELTVTGRIVDASNATLFGVVSANGVDIECVYKPVRGERPLWDFPDGTLAGREVASYAIAQAAGMALIPPTVLRADGPYGAGMAQLWVETAGMEPLANFFAPQELPDGWHGVLWARDESDDEFIFAHSNADELALMAVLDVVLNNTDRKAGHILPAPDGRVFGIDHGICLHAEDKLRTILWGWAGQALGDEALTALGMLRSRLSAGLAQDLADHITATEIQAVAARVEALLVAATYPEPPRAGKALPWPLT